MKSLIFLILFGSYLVGCATQQVQLPSIQTVKSDLFPGQISRAEYYEQIGLAYAQDNQQVKAIESYRLSILHNPNRVSARLNLADSYMVERQDHLASYELGEVLKQDPKNKMALYKLGNLYLASEIYSKARSAYTELLKLDEHNDKAIWALFYIYKIEMKYDQALRVLNQFNPGYDRLPEAVFQRALIFKITKNKETYRKLLAEAYAMNPHDKKIAAEYVEDLFFQKNFPQALVVLDNYNQTHDFDLEVSENLCYAAIQLENYDIALRELDKQRVWTSDRYLVDLKKAHIYFLINDFSKAEKMYQSLLRRKEMDEPRVYLAYVYQSQNKTDEAMATLELVPASSDYYGEAQTRIALREKQVGEPDLAINRIRKAQIKRPDQLILYKTYADFLIESKRFVETVALLEKGISSYPKDEDLRLKIAFVHYRLRNQKSFRKQIAKAVQLNPNSANIYAVLTELWYLKNKNSKEVEFFARRALELKSQNKNVQPLLAWALMDQNRSSEAVALFEQFYEENPGEHFYVSSLAQVYGWGDISTKAQEFKRVADNLENKGSLRSRLIFKIQTKSVDSDPLNSSPGRLPASLENR
ncbi:MAG: hypothetical protein H7328_00020 [Bdellovibrio sp.]|nr:hypothetical protein [Bdellovibrio sp.]